MKQSIQHYCQYNQAKVKFIAGKNVSYVGSIRSILITTKSIEINTYDKANSCDTILYCNIQDCRLQLRKTSELNSLELQSIAEILGVEMPTEIVMKRIGYIVTKIENSIGIINYLRSINIDCDNLIESGIADHLKQQS